MMNNKVKIILTAASFGIVVLIGIDRSSFAQSATQSPVAVLQQLKQVVKPQIGDSDGEMNDDVQDKQELGNLPKYHAPPKRLFTRVICRWNSGVF